MDTASIAPSPSSLTPSGSTSSTPQPASTSSTTQKPNNSNNSSSSTDFQFPPHYSFPPFFTLQPNQTTLARQLALWSSLIQAYCAHQRLHRLSLSTTASSSSTPLFHNAALNRRLDLLGIRSVIDYMASPEGDWRAEWIGVNPRAKKDAAGAAEAKSSAWIYWRRLEEWADAVYGWVDATGQRGSVLTVYELRESDAVQSQEWVGMDEEMFRRCLDVLVKRGKAQVFGETQGAGVKFF